MHEQTSTEVREKNWWEHLFLSFVFIFLLGISLGPVLGNTISHSFPVGYYAKDAYWHETYNEYVYNNGFYKTTPAFLQAGIEGLAPIQPPLLYYLVAYTSHFTGIEPYDANQLLLGLLMVLSVFVVYFIIRRINRSIAILSLPLTVFLFTFPFYAAFTWGQHLFVLGMFFLLLSVYFLLSPLTLLNILFLSVSIAATILSHTAEFVYFLPIFLCIFAVKLVKKRWKDCGKLSIALAGALVLTFDYLVVFSNTWLTNPSDPIRFQHIPFTENFGSATVFLRHFEIVQWALLAGILITLYFLFTKKKHVEEYSTFLILFGISMTTYLNQWRAYQFRFFWPVLLAFFFGLACYIVFQLFLGKIAFFREEGKKEIFYIAAAVLFFFIFAGVYHQDSQPSSIANEQYWKGIVFLEQQMTEGESALFIDPLMTQEKVLWRIKKTTPHLAMRDTLAKKAAENDRSDIFPVNVICEGAEWRRNGFFSFSKDAAVRERCIVKDASLCSYHYLFLSFQGVSQQYAEYWGRMLEQEGFNIIRNEAGVVVVKNDLPRAQCAVGGG